MPRRKRTSTAISTRRRKTRKKTRVPRYIPLNGIPQSKMVRLRYVDEISINPGLGLVGAHIFRANDMFDPDYTGVGHQPNGFDEQMAQYNHFTVLGSKITVKAFPDAASNAVPGHAGIILSDDALTAASAGSVSELLENKFVGRTITTGIFSNMARPHNQLTRTYSTKKFFRASNPTNIATYRGSDTASPVEQAFYEVFVASSAGNDPAKWDFLVTIDYIAVLTGPKYQGSS